MLQIVTRTPAELATMRTVYMRRSKAHLQDLAQRLGIETTGTKCQIVAAILPKCSKLIHTTSQEPHHGPE